MDTDTAPMPAGATIRATGAADPLRLAIGAVGLGSVTCLALLFAVGEPFGRLNDLGNATLAILSGVLAVVERRHVHPFATGLAVVGSAVAVAGSGLIISGTTGFFLAGLVSTLGFAGVGAWLIALARAGRAGSGRVRGLAMLAGALMVVGAASAPGILLRLDDMATAPGWIWIGMVGWLGIFVLYPIWALAAGRRAR
jgi:hypothetical protein